MSLSADGNTAIVGGSRDNGTGWPPDGSSGAAWVFAAPDVAPPAVFPLADLDGDGKADLVVWRASTGTWYWLTSQSGYDYARQGQTQWGNQGLGDVPLAGDIDGDGKADLVVWRASTGTWFWLTSQSGYTYAAQGQKQWGTIGDTPLLADIDGDGRTDLVVWRPSDGTWYWLTSTSGYNYAAQASKQWGTLGDRPLAADMDADGRADLAVWRSSNGTWYWLTSASAYNYAAQQSAQWGDVTLGDVPLLADVDGDNKADPTIWRSSTGTWYWLTSTSGLNPAASVARQWGNQSLGDVPLPGDVDGDHQSDLVVWRASTGTWYWLTSSGGYNYAIAGSKQWGNQSFGDVPMIR